PAGGDPDDGANPFAALAGVVLSSPIFERVLGDAHNDPMADLAATIATGTLQTASAVGHTASAVGEFAADVAQRGDLSPDTYMRFKKLREFDIEGGFADAATLRAAAEPMSVTSRYIGQVGGSRRSFAG
ncbi:unnamed protein product, partial [Amoebophrya sp. A25]